MSKALQEKFPKKRVIITGAGSGLGLELSKHFSGFNWEILAIDLDIKKLEKINCEAVQLDVTNSSLLEEQIKLFCDKNGGVDIIFNNAGIGEGVRFEDYSLTNWDHIIAVNLKAVIVGCKTILPFIKHQKN